LENPILLHPNNIFCNLKKIFGITRNAIGRNVIGKNAITRLRQVEIKMGFAGMCTWIKWITVNGLTKDYTKAIIMPRK